MLKKKPIYEIQSKSAKKVLLCNIRNLAELSALMDVSAVLI